MKLFLGVFFIIVSLYLFMGHPETDLWPRALGPRVVAAYAMLLNARPYTTILAFVFGVAFLITIKKY